MGKKTGLISGLALAGELGWGIAIPLVVLALGGQLLDRRLGSSPFFILLGMAAAITFTTVWLIIKAKRMLKDIEADKSESSAPDRRGSEAEKL